MIKYGSDRVTHLEFASFTPRLERRDNQWIDVGLRFELKRTCAEEAPQDLIDLTILVICTHGGQIAQIIPLDEGCDCEYQFTAGEKEQITAYIQSDAMQEHIRACSLEAAL
ncbi:hypothetical protein [Paenibacillus pinihumi]|uniref:hypothetical protein n=1 Tax=Paenibacillus pinihumi TaxID=669462 RepID=UPI000413A8E8|nr:hypothetical protein [Paenibacillus pinihumi]